MTLHRWSYGAMELNMLQSPQLHQIHIFPLTTTLPHHHNRLPDLGLRDIAIVHLHLLEPPPDKFAEHLIRKAVVAVTDFLADEAKVFRG